MIIKIFKKFKALIRPQILSQTNPNRNLSNYWYSSIGDEQLKNLTIRDVTPESNFENFRFDGRKLTSLFYHTL